jgi:hypothetical protein
MERRAGETFSRLLSPLRLVARGESARPLVMRRGGASPISALRTTGQSRSRARGELLSPRGKVEMSGSFPDRRAQRRDELMAPRREGTRADPTLTREGPPNFVGCDARRPLFGDPPRSGRQCQWSNGPHGPPTGRATSVRPKSPETADRSTGRAPEDESGTDIPH